MQNAFCNLTLFWILMRTKWASMRYEALALVLVAAVWLVLIYNISYIPRDAIQNLAIFGEILLSIMLGWLGASLVLGDPGFEIVILTSMKLSHLIYFRIVSIIFLASIIWCIMTVVGGMVFFRDQLTFSLGCRIFFSGFASSLFFLSLGLFLSILTLSEIAGKMGTIFIWIICLLFREALASVRPGQIIHPFLLSTDPETLNWIINSVFLSVIALVLIWLAGFLSNQRQESLLLRNSVVH